MDIRRLLFSISFVLMVVAAGVVYGTATAAQTEERYVSLGDSVAAGAGLPTTKVRSEDKRCGRSWQAYPYQVALSTGMQLEHLACSGAKADKGIYGKQQIGRTKITPQLDAAFESGIPRVMTITIGANDARWLRFVSDCYVRSCGSDWDNLRAKAHLLDLRWELYMTLHRIRQRSGDNPPKVVFTGYYDPLAGKACEITPNITQGESRWLSSKIADLNDAIKDATASAKFAAYTKVDFTGHGLCSDDPWVQGLRDRAPVHPTAEGQAAIARAVLITLDSE